MSFQRKGTTSDIVSIAYVVNVGANSSHASVAQSPMFNDSGFVYVSFQTKRAERTQAYAGSARSYGDRALIQLIGVRHRLVRARRCALPLRGNDLQREHLLPGTWSDGYAWPSEQG